MGAGGNMPWQGGDSGQGWDNLGNDWLSVNPGGMFNDIKNGISGKKGADAAQRAMEDQLAEARSVRTQAMGIAGAMGTDATKLAQATPQELSAYGDSLTAAGKNLQNQQNLLSAVDPALMEASKQILSIMRGDGSSLNQGMYAGQRQKLLDNLRAQYGPGAEATSIGQRALQQFDANAQGQQLGQLQGVIGMGQNLQQGVQSGIGTLTGTGQNFGNLQARQLQTRLGVGQSTLAALTGTSQPVINASGAPYTSDFIQSQNQQQFMNKNMELFGQIFGGKGAAAMA